MMSNLNMSRHVQAIKQCWNSVPLSLAPTDKNSTCQYEQYYRLYNVIVLHIFVNTMMIFLLMINERGRGGK